MSKLITGLITTVIVIAVLGFTADYLLKQNLGIGLGDIFNVIITSSATEHNARSITELSVGNETPLLIDEKEMLEGKLSNLTNFISKFNSNTNATDLTKNILGEHYTMYLFSVTELFNETFKVFEWSVEFTNGSITVFEPGMVMVNYNVMLQFSHELAMSLLSGEGIEMSSEDASAWITEGAIKVNPITEAVRVATLLPSLMGKLKE